MNNTLSEIGVFGLGVMGSALSLNFADNHIRVSVFNRNEGSEQGTVERFIEANEEKSVTGFTEIHEFLHSLEKPRKVLLMVSAPAVDKVIEQLLPILEPGDILLDAGNSHYEETLQRQSRCRQSDIEFLGVGVSGGEKGARFGPSIMPGGSETAYKHFEPYLEKIAARDKNDIPCTSFIGPQGSGHFVKMVHNGIEYVEMQLLAEIYQLLRQTKSNNEISEILNEWNKEEEKSFLLDISAKIFTKKVNNEFLLDLILDKAGNKGTGSWSTIAALMMGSDNSIMSSAVFARYLSSFKRVRSFLGGQDSNNEKQTPIDVHVLQQAYNCARKLNHIQGFELIRAASVEKSWNINCSELARVWTNGCIIRSTLMEELSIYFTECDSLLTNNEFLEKVRKDEQYISMVIHNAVANRIAIPVFSSTWNYWIGLTTANGPTNLIQAQRDFFGAHTYQRIDDPRGESYHTNWEE